MDDMYREEILAHYKRPHNWGPMDDPDLEFSDTNPLCGDELKVMLRVGEDDTVQEVRFDGHGCAISQAAASMASDEVKGMSVDDLVRLDRSFVLDLLGHRHLRDADEVRAALAEGHQERRPRRRGGLGARDPRVGRPDRPGPALARAVRRTLDAAEPP